MGSPEFAVPSLRALCGAGHRVVLAVSQPDKPAGRGGKLQKPAVKVAAEELGIETFQPITLREDPVQERLAAAKADVFVVAAYGKILPQAVLDIPRRGCLNVHGSLLPKWRGPSPIVAAILAGDSETGVSIMELVRKMDAGPVISRKALSIEPNDTAASLEPRLARLGADELVRVLPGWLSGELTAEPQDETGATYCHILNKQDGHLKANMSVDEAERAVRAYNPWPGAFVLYNGERLAIWQAHIAQDAGDDPDQKTRSNSGRTGSTTTVDRAPAIAFEDGMLVLDEVQRPGGKRVSGAQFLAGERGLLSPLVGLA
jgi:methionyl-tRNA formyltransferase